MANTYTLIANATSQGTYFEFLNIPQTYTDLLVKVSGRNDGSNQVGAVWIYPNASNANMTLKQLFGSGNGSGSNSGQVISNRLFGYIAGGNATADQNGTIDFYITNYTSSANKSISVDSANESNSSGGPRLNIAVGLWSNSAAITSLELRSWDFGNGAAANFSSPSTATLYGIKSS